MQPKVWNEEPRGDIPKPVSLRLVQDGDETLLLAVNEDGQEVAILLTFTREGVFAHDNARDALEDEGYDSTFSQWSRDGAMALTGLVP